MTKATRAVCNRIAVVFDFDETLTPEDSFQTLLRYLGLDVEEFKANRIQPLLDQGWEKYLARAYCLLKESQQRGEKITKTTLAEVGEHIQLYEGTQDLFERLQRVIRAVKSDIELEFYLISGGFVDIPRNTSLAKDFKRMWGCEFHYSESGAIEFLKKQMTHVEKTRYLYYLSKGTDSPNEKDLVYNYEDLPPEASYIPLAQVIYVGDGTSDVPCFAAIKRSGGISIGLYGGDSSAEEWQHLEEISSSQRLSSLVQAGYTEDSALMKSLSIGVECIAKQITLRQIGEEK